MTEARPPADDGDVREPGHTRDVGWEIGVQRAFDRPVEAVWALLTDDIGLRTWLGEGAALLPEKGHRYATTDGTTGEVRSFHPLDRVRLTWRPTDWDHDSTLQVTVTSTGQGTAIRFHQERLAGAAERSTMRAHWTEVLTSLQRQLEEGPST